MTDELRKKINDHYQKGQGSIQDIARVYRFTVDEVLEALGMTDVGVVEEAGDQISQEDAGEVPVIPMKKHKQTFTTD